MPSPFPGMDPYLENPHLWPDVHHSLAGQIRDQLNHVLPGEFFAQMEQRMEVGILDDEEDEDVSRYIPDVSINAAAWSDRGESVAVIEQPRAIISPSEEWDVDVKMHKHLFVEVREASGQHRLVTLIEIVSPSNKRGKDRKAFIDKQNEVIANDASLVEIDLLRTGRRILPSEEIEQRLKRRKIRADYLVLIGRAWDRTPSRQHYQLFPFTLRDTLPVIPIPLREDDAEPTLDLQFLLQRVYDGGPYRRGAVNYSQPPDPPLTEAESTWAAQFLTPRNSVNR
ncbi:MAG: DUF4058 family protein [Planctomycetaceae bacterium]